MGLGASSALSLVIEHEIAGASDRPWTDKASCGAGIARRKRELFQDGIRKFSELVGIGEGKSEMTDWDTRYLEVARLIAGWSKDPNAGVGAVIVRDNRIVATGYNGFPEHVLDDDRLKDKAVKQEMVVHAEVNATLSAGERARGATIYVHGKPICARCASSLIQAGVKRIVAARPKPAIANEPTEASARPGYVDWDHKGRIACEMFAEAGIQVHHKALPHQAQVEVAPSQGGQTPANDPFAEQGTPKKA